MSIRGVHNSAAFEPFNARPQPTPSLWTRTTALISSLFAKSIPPAPSSNGDFDLFPPEVQLRILSQLDLRELAHFGSTSKELNRLVSDNNIWLRIAEQINCPVDPKSDLVVYKQVLRFIDRIQSELRRINGPEILKIRALTIAEINHAQEWLEANEDLRDYKRLIADLKKWAAKLPDFHVRFPKVKSLSTSSAQIAQAQRLRKWAEENKPLLQAIDTLKVWSQLARAIGLPPPQFHDLHVEADVLHRANQFSVWFANHRHLLIIVPELALRDLHLTSLPKEIGKLTNLQILNLSGNLLNKLPDKLGKLVNLRTLFLGSNRFSSISPEIGKLIHLRTLDLSKNRLSLLTPNIEKLTELDTLYLDDNKFSYFPDDILKLPLLKTLFLNSNFLECVPPEIERLSDLVHFHIDHNLLTSLPAETGNLSKLRYFDCRYNRLTGLPRALVKWNFPGSLLEFDRNPIPLTKFLYYLAKTNPVVFCLGPAVIVCAVANKVFFGT